MTEYIVDTTQAEREYENMFPVFAVKFDRLLGCPLGEKIVRCKDCKYYEYLANIDFHDCTRQVPSVKPYGFCAWGEVKANE